jgi:hypothetical protein
MTWVYIHRIIGWSDPEKRIKNKKGVEHFQWNAPSNLAPSGAGLLILKLFWRQKARVVLGLKISGMIKEMAGY